MKRPIVPMLAAAVVTTRDPQCLSHLMGGIWWAATGKGQQR